jgi:hypothetical protein
MPCNPTLTTLETRAYKYQHTAHSKSPMATAPIRPRAFAAWLTEVTDTAPAPPDARRHALCLFGHAKTLFTRWCPAVLCPEFCTRQTLDTYTPDVWQRVEDNTQLLVFRNCTVADVWRDRKDIERALRDVHLVFLFENQVRDTKSPQPFLARSVGMRGDGSIFLCVTSEELASASDEGAGGAAAPADQPPMVEVLASKKRCFDQTLALIALGIKAETARELVKLCAK